MKQGWGSSRVGCEGAWESRSPTCDLWGLHHGFLEESFCLCEGQERVWCAAQTLVPRRSLREAVLLVCGERLQAIHQRPRWLLAWQAVEEGQTLRHCHLVRASTVPAPASTSLLVGWGRGTALGLELVPPLRLLGRQCLFLPCLLLQL